MIGHDIPCHLDTFVLIYGRLMGMLTVSNSTLTYLEVNTSPCLLVYSLTCIEFVSTLPIDNLIWRTVVTSTLIYHEASLKSLRERRGDVHSNKTTDETFFTSFGTQLFAFRAVSVFADSCISCSLLETMVCIYRPPELQLRGNLAIPSRAAITSLRLASWKIYRIPTSVRSTAVFLSWPLHWTWATQPKAIAP